MRLKYSRVRTIGENKEYLEAIESIKLVNIEGRVEGLVTQKSGYEEALTQRELELLLINFEGLRRIGQVNMTFDAFDEMKEYLKRGNKLWNFIDIL